MTTNDEIKQKASEKEWDYSASFKDKADDYENYLMNEARADQLRIDTYNRVQSLKQARAGARSSAIAYMRVARSSMCLKDRAILLNEINLLETELKKLEE